MTTVEVAGEIRGTELDAGADLDHEHSLADRMMARTLAPHTHAQTKTPRQKAGRFLSADAAVGDQGDGTE
jgi:hypothetical protein